METLLFWALRCWAKLTVFLGWRKGPWWYQLLPRQNRWNNLQLRQLCGSISYDEFLTQMFNAVNSGVLRGVLILQTPAGVFEYNSLTVCPDEIETVTGRIPVTMEMIRVEYEYVPQPSGVGPSA